MAYEVTVHTAAEIAAHQRKVEEKGQSCGDLAQYQPAQRTAAVLYLSFPRPATNLCTQKEWIEMLACAVQGCRRKDNAERGLSQVEFEQLADRRCGAGDPVNGFSIPMKGGWRRGIKPAELKALRKMLGW